MITLHLREHATHNSGFGFDKFFNLDSYSSGYDLVEELMEYTKGICVDNGLDLEDYTFEEWLITDLEIDSDFVSLRDIGFDEYMSLDSLIELNDTLNEKENEILLMFLFNDGCNIEQALKHIENGFEVSYIELEFGRMASEEEQLAEHLWEEGLIEIPDNLLGYIDWEKLGRDFAFDYRLVESSSGRKFYYLNY